MKTRIPRDGATARRPGRPIPAAMGTAGWAQAEADRARIRSVLRAPPDWKAPATTSVPASTTQHGAPIAAPADIVRTDGYALDPARPRAGEQAETIAKHGSRMRIHTEAEATQSAHAIDATALRAQPVLLQRKCVCGANASGLTGECAECSKKKMVGLQTKLRINEAGDIYEHEADRVAEQVLAKPARPHVSGAPPRIQRFSGQSSGQTGAAPASVDRALASPGRPLDPALRQDMEHRFGQDFGAVRVHADARAAESARAVNALAYTAGSDIVFDTGQYAPSTTEGRRLLAHELAHTIQQGRIFGPFGTGETDPDRTAAQNVLPMGTPVKDSVLRTTGARANGGIIQRQPESAAPVESRQIKKIILYKNQMTAAYVFQDNQGHESRETIGVQEHCDPPQGTYSAKVITGTLHWTTSASCTRPLGFIIRNDSHQYTRFKIAEGFKVVRTFEFEVSDAAVGGVENASETGGQGLGPGSMKGGTSQDPGGAVTYYDPLDQILEEIAALPQHIKEFLTSDKGRPLRPQDYEIVLRIGKRLEFEGVSELELYDLKNRARRARSWAETEASFDRVFEERSSRQQQRARNVAEREDLEVRLSTDITGLYVNVYRRYYDVTKGSKDSFLFSKEAAALREELNAELPQYGFRDVADFEKTINDYLASFTNETLAIASDLLLKFDYILTREKAKFKSPQSPHAVRLRERFGPVRQTAQSSYQQAEEASLKASLEQLAATVTFENVPLFGGSEQKKPHTERMKEHQREAKAHEEQAGRIVETEAIGHDIVSWQDFPREQLVSAASASDIRDLVIGYINEHIAAVSKARAILESPKGRDRIFELDNLLDMSFAAQGIEKGSLQGLIIFDHRDDIEREKSAKDLLLGLITLALSVVVPVGGAVGFVVGSGLFVIGAFQADEMLQAYAEDQRLYMAQLLSSEPSIAWAVIAVIASGVDGAAAVKAIKTVVAPAARAFNESARAAEDLAKLGRSLEGLEGTIQNNIMTAARKAAKATEQFESQVQKLKELWTTGGVKLRAAAIPGGETLARIVAITYYFLKSRVVAFTFADYLEVLQKAGVIEDIGKLTVEQRKMFRRAFVEALDRSRTAQFAYGEQVFNQLSERARAAFTLEQVDLIAAEGKAMGKTDDEIREAVESRSLQEEHIREAEEAASGERALEPSATADLPPTTGGKATAEITEEAAPSKILTDIEGEDEVASTVRSDGNVEVTYGGKSTTISLADQKGNHVKLVKELGLDSAQATRVLQDIRGTVPPEPKILISFAQAKGNPVEYLTGRLRDPAGENRWASDAFEHPPKEGIRNKARDPGVDAPETLRLSEYAYVFEEQFPNQFKPKGSETVKGVQEYQYPKYPGGPRGGGALTKPRAIVRVDANGVIVEIVDSLMPRGELIELFNRLGWKVKL